MKNIFEKTLVMFAATLMIFSFSTNAFATNNYYYRGIGGKGTYYQYSVKLINGSGSEKITVVNTGNSPLYVYIDGRLKTTIYPVKETTSTHKNEYTIAYSLGGSHSIKLQPTRSRNETQSFRIKTTGYKDTITKVR